MVQKTRQLLAGEGVTTAEEQFPYWFTRAMTVLIAYTDEGEARHYASKLGLLGIRSKVIEVHDPQLPEKLVEWDITIIHNISRRRKWRLWWVARCASLKLFNPPLIVNAAGFSGDIISQYRSRFEAQKI